MARKNTTPADSEETQETEIEKRQRAFTEERAKGVGFLGYDPEITVPGEEPVGVDDSTDNSGKDDVSPV